MRCLQILVAASAILISPAAFASDPARQDRVGELAPTTPKQICAEIRQILKINSSDKKKNGLLAQYMRGGDSFQRVEKILGPPKDGRGVGLTIQFD